MSHDSELKVLFLTRYPIEGASSRYRVYQYLDHLEQLGVGCTVQSFMDKTFYQTTMQSGKTFQKLWMTLKAFLARFLVLLKWKEYDVIYMQRELFPFGPPIIERILKKRGAIIFFDYDDALFINKSSRYNPIASLLRSPDKTRDMFRIADCTVAGNDWLRDSAIKEGGHAVTLEVAEDTDRYLPRVQPNEEFVVTVGWLGSPSTVKYLNLIQEPLRKLAKEYPHVKWEIIGGNEFSMEGVPWINRTWSLEEEVDALSRFDIGLMPLPQDEWSNGKSGGKARTYMAAGVVPVCTAIGYNLELIRHGETGFLCETGDQWFSVISELIEERNKRLIIADSAIKDVKERFSQARQAKRMFSLFHEFVSEQEHRNA